MRLTRCGIVLLVVFAACGGSPGDSSDFAGNRADQAQGDLGEVGDDLAGDLGVDLSGQDLAGADLAMPDLAMDLAVPVDLATAHDLAQPPDLAIDPCATDGGVPSTLACTGLYADFASKTIAANVQAFTPGHQLWSDGAHKQRYIYLPPGGQIDVSNMADWVFPVGTKLWKQFVLTIGGVDHRIETRMLWKRGAGNWAFTVYRWSDDETAATHFPDGLLAVPGTTYEIPAENRCTSCHHDRIDASLGFEAVLLASPTATGLTYAQLQAGGLLTATNGNQTVPGSALQIPGNELERSAIGYLHANCGVACHRYTSIAPFSMFINASSGMTETMLVDTGAFHAINATAFHVLANPPYASANYYRIRPLDVTRSEIHLRMSARDVAPGTYGGQNQDQMPPLVSHTVDTNGVALVDSWINSMSAAPYPAPAAP